MSTPIRRQLVEHEQTFKDAQRPAWALAAARHQQGWAKLPFGHVALDLTDEEFERAIELAMNHAPGTEIEQVRPLKKALEEQAAADKALAELLQKRDAERKPAPEPGTPATPTPAPAPDPSPAADEEEPR